MVGAGRYAELAAAVRSFKAELIQPNQIERLVEAGSISETVGLLTGGRVTYVEGSGTNSVEVFLTQRFMELTKRLVAYAPYDSRSLIKLFLAWHELECIKVIIRSIADQTSPEEALRRLVPVGRFTEERCKELIEARNLGRVVEMIGDDGLKHFLAPRLASERSAMAVSAIDQFYYSRLWSASNLPDPLDAQSARGLIGEYIDHQNILLAFRGRLMGLDSRSVSDLMIPVNYALAHTMNELVESASTQNLVRILEKTPYARALEGRSLSANNLADIDLLLKRSHAVTCFNAFAGSPFNIGLALAFLFLKNYELRDLFSIVNGKVNNAPMDHLLDSLILRAS